MKSSTREFIREARRIPGYSFLDFLHGYVYIRWPYLYISIGTGEHPLARLFGPILRWIGQTFHKKPDEAETTTNAESLPLNPIGNRIQASGTFADNYHGKVVPLKAATQLVTIGEEICLTNLEQVIPYPHARDIVLQNPDHIAVLECPCRAARSNPCQPLDVCLIIGEPFTSFILEHHPRKSRRITPKEAVDILKAEDERGHVHHAFFKDAMFGRFYAICNCCSCCCGAMQAHQRGIPMLASSGYVAQVDSELCIGCGICTDFCQFGALSVIDQTLVVDLNVCMGCGVCIDKCAQGALAIKRDPQKGEPLEIHELIAGAIRIPRP